MPCSPRTLVAFVLVAAASANGAPLPPAASPGIVSHIRRLPVESTALAAIGYSKRLRALEIEFRNGAIYRYLEVPGPLYQNLMNAPSKTRFYDKHIRRKYRSIHVRPRSG